MLAPALVVFGWITTSVGAAASAPEVPTGLIAASTANGSATISFTAPASDGGLPITNYYYSIDNGVTWIARSPASAASPLVIPGLVNGRSYTIKLSAVNSAGAGNPSDGLSVTVAASLPTTGTAGARYVAVGEGGQVLTSTDGASWSSVSSGVTTRLRGVTSRAGTVLAVGHGGTILFSADGVNWTQLAAGIPAAASQTDPNAGDTLRGVAASAARFVAVGGHDTGRIFTSDDGGTWTEANLGGARGRLRSVVRSSTTFVAVGEGGTILSSLDGLTWNPRTSGTTERLDGVVWTGTQFQVITSTGKLHSSADGETWSAATNSNAPSWVEGIAWSANRVVMLGAGGRIRSSDDGETWTWQNSNVTGIIHGVTYTGPFAAQTVAAATLFGNLRKLTVTGITAANKTYDRTTAATLTTTGATLAGVYAGDAANITLSTVNATGVFASADVGNGKTVTISGLTISGSGAADYTLTQPSTTANITQAGVTISGLSASNKVYDRTNAATLTGTPTAAGVISGDTVNVTGSATEGTFAQTGVGNGIAVAANLGGLSLSNANYTISGVTSPLTANITQAGVTISGLAASNKVYDRTDAATLTGTPTAAGVISGDTVNVTGTATAGTFAQSSVGTVIAVTPNLGGLALSNANYTISGVTSPLTANITQAGVTISGLTASNKTYDRTNAATLTGTPTAAGVISGDTVNVTGTATAGTFVQTGVGTGIAVTANLGGLALSNANYTISGVTSPLNANITAKSVTVTGTSAANKVYDGTVSATPSFSASALSGVISGDAVALVTTGGSATFANKNVAAGKTVTVAGLSLSGGDAVNYSLTQPTTTANITAKTLTVSGAKAVEKTFDGSASAGLNFSGAQLVGVVTGDVVSLVTSVATGAFADSNAGQEKAVTVSGLSLSGTDAGNYSLIPPQLTASILRRPVVFTLSGLEQTYNGSALSVSVTPSIPVPHVVAYSAAGVPVQPAPINSGSYSVIVSTSDNNYIGLLTATMVVGKARQTVSISAPSSATLAAPVAVSATSTSGLPVVLSVSGPATLNSGQINFQMPGTAIITATQAGNANYSEATATASVTVAGKMAQTIAFAAPADRLSNSGPLTLSATATSGLPVAFSVVSGPALLTGNVVALRGDAGRVIVRASQAGDARFEAAPDVTASFQVTAATVNVYFGNVTSATPGAAAPKVGDIAAAIPPNSNRGSLLVVAPAVGLNRALDFQFGADGTFEQTFVIDGPAAGILDTPPVAAAPVTVKLKGRLLNGRLSGTVEPLGLTFDAPVQPVVGTSANAAGFYRSSTLANTAGATYSIVGTNSQVLVLATTPAVTTGGLTTLGGDGTFALQTNTTAGAATIRGTVDEPTTTVAGSISIAGTTTQFAGLVTTTTRTDRLVNLSSRVRISGGDSVLITGFVIGGTAPKQVLIRGIGPALTGFGVGGALANPKLKIYRGSTLVSENDDWAAETVASFSRVGAFGLASGSRDAALVATLEPGAYTAHVSDGGAAGVALAEIYDASVNPAAEYQRLINISTRGEVTAGEGVLIGGFVVTGNSPKRLLIRGVGPGLAAFGVGGVLADPRLRVYRNADLQAENDNWSTVAAEGTASADAAREAGAFALAAGSRDSALIVTLAPGAYTAQITAADGTATGSALIEIYELP